MVENEITIDFDQLIARPLTEAWITLCCVSNEVGGDLIGNAYWSGVLVRDLLAEAGVKAGADAVRQTSKDGWTCGTPLSALTDPDRNAMLAIAMNGEPLPLEHGFPVRMVVPGLYGYVSATKWLVDLEVTTVRRVAGVLDPARLVAQKGPVQDPVADRRTRATVPRVKAGSVGSAAAPGRSTPASRRSSTSSTAVPGRRPSWAGCRTPTPGCSGPARVDVDPGEHRLYVRATDSSGYTQTAAQGRPVPERRHRLGHPPPSPPSESASLTVDGHGRLRPPVRLRRWSSAAAGASGGPSYGCSRSGAATSRSPTAAHEEEAARVAAEAASFGVRVSQHQLDIVDPGPAAPVVGGGREHHGGLHTLVHAAGPHVPMVHLSRVEPGDLATQLADDAGGFFNVVRPGAARHCARPRAASSRSPPPRRAVPGARRPVLGPEGGRRGAGAGARRGGGPVRRPGELRRTRACSPTAWPSG